MFNLSHAYIRNIYVRSDFGLVVVAEEKNCTAIAPATSLIKTSSRGPRPTTHADMKCILSGYIPIHTGLTFPSSSALDNVKG